MNTCTVCGYKIISNKHFAKHMESHPTEEVKPVVSEEAGIPAVEVISEPAPVVQPEPVAMVTDEITIRFSKPIEVQINGVHYDGIEVKVKDMAIAAEIVRIAREAYGPGILL